MVTSAPATPSASDAYRPGGAALAIAAGAILFALMAEHVWGMIPCPLCLQQRYAFYAGIPVLIAALATAPSRPRFAAFLFFAVSLAFLANAGLGTYHAGAEWKFWPGPDTCGSLQSTPTSAADLLKNLEKPAVRCDEAAWRFLGLSFAGWNVVTSLLLFALAIKAAFSASPNAQ
jgi:disulfide bond formation protein DsbB